MTVRIFLALATSLLLTTGCAPPEPAEQKQQPPPASESTAPQDRPAGTSGQSAQPAPPQKGQTTPPEPATQPTQPTQQPDPSTQPGQPAPPGQSTAPGQAAQPGQVPQSPAAQPGLTPQLPNESAQANPPAQQGQPTQPGQAPQQNPVQAGKPAPGAKTAKTPASQGLSLQVALDRAGFSPGVIDGKPGATTKKALEAYKKQHNADPQPSGEPTTTYQITEQDAAGPFEPKIPKELPDQAKLPALAYKSLTEALAERFHTSPEFLQKLNPGAKFAAGETITVPNVEPMQVPTSTEAKAEQKGQKPAAKQAQQGAKQSPAKQEGARGTSGQPPQAGAGATGDVVVTVSKSRSALTVTDASGKVLMFAPVTTGSARDPLPIGEWKVNGVTIQPPFRYNPDLFWDADPSHTKALIKPGPNNPVGLVWIDLSKEHYGIHGTPEPQTVGRTQSHGCVRLTNWDALRLASLVKPGTKVVFTS